jgi:hypothetical protein
MKNRFEEGEKVMKIRASCCLVALVGLIVIYGTASADDESERNTLRGLKGIYVFVEPLKEELVRDGLTVDAVRTDAELKLRLKGIRVLSEEEWYNEPGGPHLYIAINALKLKPTNTYVFAIYVGLKQGVSLVRSSDIEVFGITWSTWGVGITTKLQDIRVRIEEHLDRFIDAYMSVNPKEVIKKQREL